MTQMMLSILGPDWHAWLTILLIITMFATLLKTKVPVAALSAFLSNSTVVAMFINAVKLWAKKLNIAPGRLYIPLSYAAGMGGICTLMISVSSSFATPIGSPTHLMVYGPGGYRFNDFMKIGIPMNFIILAANIFITTLVFPL